MKATLAREKGVTADAVSATYDKITLFLGRFITSMNVVAS